MEDKQFDQHIKNQLEQLRAESNAQHWSQMEQRLDLEFGELMEIEEQVLFDTEIQQKLNDHQVSFNPLHWSILKARLDLTDDRVRRVYASKAFEIAFFFLVILFFIRVNPIQSHKYQNAPVTVGENNEMAYNTSENDNSKPQLSTKSDQESSITKQAVDSELESNITEQAFDSEQEQINIPLAQNLGTTNEDSVLEAQFNQEVQSVDQNFVSVINTIETIPVEPVISQFNQNTVAGELFADADEREDLSQVQKLTSLDLAALNYMDDKIIIPLHANASSGFKAKWFNITASRDANLLNESVLAVLDPDSLVGSYGLSLGLGYSVQKNHLEFETGLTYSNKKIPINQSQITGDTRAYIRSSVINSQLHMAQIPILVKYHFAPKSKIGFYAGSGVNVNLLMHSKELVKDQNLDSARPSAFIAVPASNLSFVEEHSSKGLIEGGKFSENAYISMNFVIGLQARITPGLSMFIQPSYQHHIFSNSFGPNEDKIHVLSLQLGSKFRF